MQETETAALTGGGSGQASRDTVSTLMPTGRMAWQDGTAGQAAGKVLGGTEERTVGAQVPNLQSHWQKDIPSPGPPPPRAYLKFCPHTYFLILFLLHFSLESLSPSARLHVFFFA